MRRARSYSIVDHALLRGGYLARISHQGLALYLFLVVVGDRNGRSFYSDASIGGILRQSGSVLADARRELMASGLIRYQRPYWWVEDLTCARIPKLHPCPQELATAANRAQERSSCHETVPISGIVPEALRNLIRTLEEKS